VIVFLAVSGAQKSRRDSQRKNDLSRFSAQLESYASNNAGNYPANQAALSGAAFTPYIPTNFKDPSSGNTYGFGALGTVGNITYTLGGTACDGATALSARQYRVQMQLEQGVACVDNH
jgi:type II secretory pathway pseudopilin PulG